MPGKVESVSFPLGATQTRNYYPASILTASLEDQANKIARLIVDHAVVPLVGAGVSAPSRLPLWSELVINLLEKYAQVRGRSGVAKDIATYTSSAIQVFSDNRTGVCDYNALSSYIKASVEADKEIEFRTLLDSALYEKKRDDSLSEFVPNSLHYHLVHLFSGRAAITTTNFDDLLEKAAIISNISFACHHPDVPRTNSKTSLTINHLHGFIPDQSNVLTHDYNLTATTSDIVISESDFYRIADDHSGWTHSALNYLAHSNRLLIVGMSLTDPNLRRTLAVTKKGRDKNGDAPHLAILPRPRGLSDEAIEILEEYWSFFDVELVLLPDITYLSAFLFRIRVLVSELEDRSIMRLAAKSNSDLHLNNQIMRTGCNNELRELAKAISASFNVESVVDVGIFLLEEDRDSGDLDLRLRYRSGVDDRDEERFAKRLKIKFFDGPNSLDDSACGIAGRVFASASPCLTDSNDPRMHRSEHGPGEGGPDFDHLYSIPLFSWNDLGLPIGVMYLTSRSNLHNPVSSRLYELATAPSNSHQSLDKMYAMMTDRFNSITKPLD